MKKGFTLVEVIITFVILGFVLFWTIGWLMSYKDIWNKYPECRFARDPITCSAIMENK